MKYMIGGLVSVLLAAVYVVAAGPSAPQEEMALDVELDEFSVEKARITEVVRKLARASQVRICVEEQRLFPREGDTDARIQELERKRNTGLSLTLEQPTAREVLDRIAAADPAYTWKWDEETGTVNIYPREDAPLGWRITSIEFKDKTIDEVLFSGDLLGLRTHDIMFTHLGGNVSWLETPVSLNAEDITARQAMNLLCAQLGFKAHWELWGRAPRQARASWILVIRGYGDRPEDAARHRGEEEEE